MLYLICFALSLHIKNDRYFENTEDFITCLAAAHSILFFKQNGAGRGVYIK